MADRSLRNAINWFEIPVRDLDRAQKFYETVLSAPMQRAEMGEDTMLMFQYDQEQGAVGGCLVAGKNVPDPAMHGTLVYLNAAPAIDAVLARVTSAGGRITTPKTALPPGMGFFAVFADTEGNRVGLHALA